MKNVYVVYSCDHVGMGPPVAVFSTADLAQDWIDENSTPHINYCYETLAIDVA